VTGAVAHTTIVSAAGARGAASAANHGRACPATLKKGRRASAPPTRSRGRG
jgi:hypothetical protein